MHPAPSTPVHPPRSFRRYVTGQELPGYESLLDRSGLLLRTAKEGRASLGPVGFRFRGQEVLIDGNTIIGSPLYEGALERYEPGDTATIHFVQRGIERSAAITFVEDPTLEVVTFESAELDVSEAQLDFREAWLGPDSETDD